MSEVAFETIFRHRPDVAYPQKRRAEEYKRHNQAYFYAGLKICRGLFCLLHDIGPKQLQAICDHVDDNRDTIKARVHGNTSRLPPNTTEFEEAQAVKAFILNTGRVRGMPLPGRLPGLRDTEGYYLATDETKMKIYTEYLQAAREDGRVPVKSSSFYSLWNQLVPEVKILTPQTDLCDVCHDHCRNIMHSGHLSENEKRNIFAAGVAHIDAVKAEREYYNSQIGRAREEENASHISFDYAQQIHYPYDSEKVGSAFFKTARKCGIFGVCEESPEDVQVNYLIDEAEQVGKGANVVVSMIDHYLAEHWEPTPVLLFHADNCVGQNKNNTMIQYLMWHLLTSETEKIEISFMVSGHTKFAPDRHFGLIKKKYALAHKLDTMRDIQNLVIDSSPAGHNKEQAIRDPRTDTICVVWHDWSMFLKKSFKNIPYITKYHHFRMDKENPGFVRCLLTPNSEEDVFNIMKSKTVDSSAVPPVIHSEGLSLARQKYLHEQISGLCSGPLAASITCPKP